MSINIAIKQNEKETFNLFDYVESLESNFQQQKCQSKSKVIFVMLLFSTDKFYPLIVSFSYPGLVVDSFDQHG